LRKFFIIINPVSGKREAEKKLLTVKIKFRESGIDFNEFRTDPGLMADEIVRKFFNPGEFTDILIIGGDGTINQVFNGLRENNAPVSLISSGTGNDIARSLLGTLKIQNQLDLVLNGKVRLIDAGICNGRIFLNGLGIGFDGKVVERMSLNYKKYKGPLAYYSTVIRLLSGYREAELKIKLDDSTYDREVFLMTVSKGRTFGGGFRLNPFAANNDGKLDICLIRKVPVFKRFIMLPTMSFGGHKYLKEVEFYKCTECWIEANNYLVAHLDGEYVGHPPFHIKILPRYFNFRGR
jgi:diacylglycerol kinase (ATP)